MSTCDTCSGNPCCCCEHYRVFDTCADCANDRAGILEEEFDALQERVEALEAIVQKLHTLRTGDF